MKCKRNTGDIYAAMKSLSKYGDLEILKLLLLKYPQVDISYEDGNCYTPLTLAAENGHINVVKFLMEDAMVDPSDKDNYAIIVASKYGHVEVVK